MKKYKRKTGLFILAAAIVAVAFLVSTTAFRKAEEKEDVWIHLNDTLTNAMSTREELSGMDARIEKFLRTWSLKGASVAITRNDSLLFAKAYGWADEQKGEKMSPRHILRIASVSKLITAVGIMKLQEEGKLHLADTVFGPRGILNDSCYCSWIKDRNMYNITVEHLLRHKGGFRRDPLFSSTDVMAQLGLTAPPTEEDMMKLTLRSGLRFRPGEWQKYSNVGYLFLSKVIEKVSGQSYEHYMKQVLAEAGCYDFQLTGIYYRDRHPNEVRYYTHAGDGHFTKEYNNSGRMVERCYGGSDYRLLSGAGAWAASPAEICRLVSSINYCDAVPEILSEDSIRAMTEYFDPDTYSLGWNDTKEQADSLKEQFASSPTRGGTWTRTGTLSGTSALVKCFPDGECWVIVTNTSTWKGPGFSRETARLFDDCRRLYGKVLPKQDLFSL